MEELFTNLKPFFEDCYIKLGVREYSRLVGISHPTASKTLKRYFSEGLLLKARFRNHTLFSANNESKTFIDLSRIYWSIRLEGVVLAIEERCLEPTIVLFGSLSSAEVMKDSDVDIAVFSPEKEINFEVFEKKLKRRIQAFWFDSLKAIPSKELRNSVANGHVLRGRLVL